MNWLWDTLLLVHVLGLALGVGAGTVKLVLLLRCRSDAGLVPAYLTLAPTITKVLLVGLVLVTLSGIAWLFLGVGFRPVLIAKVILVGALWVLGPFIDKAAEPRFRKFAPAAGQAPSREFIRSQNHYLALEFSAGVLFYSITVLGVLL